MQKDTLLKRRRKRKNEKIEAFTFLEHDFAPFEGKIYLFRSFIGFIFIFIDAGAVFSHEKKPFELMISISSAVMLFILARCFMYHSFKDSAVIFVLLSLLSAVKAYVYSAVKGEPMMSWIYFGFVFYYLCAAIGSATINTHHHPMILYYVAIVVRAVLPFLKFCAQLLEEMPEDSSLLSTALLFGGTLTFSFIKMYFDVLTLYIVYHKPRRVRIMDLV